MSIQLSTKERMLLEDQKSQEELCVKKYQDYSNKAQDPELKQLFSSLSQKEQEHLNSINQILSGTIPNVQQSQQSKQMSEVMQSNKQADMNASMSAQMPSQGSSQGSSQSQESGSLNDSLLCADMLSTEKFVSGTYNIAIFECTNPSIRQVLNHIQKEEQEHGEQLFNYMQSKGMYNVQ